ncbi:glycoside hydrolase family 172 protein [Arthrobacter pigmenti]
MANPNLSNIAALRSVSTRSISPENFDGSVGGGGRAMEGTGRECARDLGAGWKISPSVKIAPGETFSLAKIEGAAKISHIWMTTHRDHWRTLLFRAYWDGADEPAIEVPYGDFFCSGWGQFSQVNSEPIAANPNGGFNSYWPMPFRNGAELTIENTSTVEVVLYYQVTYEVGGDHSNDAYLHAQWRRSNPLPYKETHTILDGVEGKGHYAGTYMAWGVNSNGWWGEGEIKFYMDSDEEYPTICGTGTEDYFGGAWNFDVPGSGYTEFSTAYLGMPQVIRPDGLYVGQQRFGMYRWHLPDPIHFAERLRVDIQALGWRSGWRYLPLQDDIASTAFFYLDRPIASRPAPPTADEMEIHIGAGPSSELGRGA